MKKLNKTLMIGALVVGAATIFGTSQANAFWGEDLLNNWKSRMMNRPDLTTEQQASRDERWAEMGDRHEFMEEKHESMITIFENGDYQGWLGLMGDKPVAQEISEDEFARFTEMHNFHVAGDLESAEDIAEELGLPDMRAMHRENMGEGQGYGMRNGSGFGGRGMHSNR